MQDRAGKDAKTLSIGRVLAVLVLVLVVGALLLAGAERLGVDFLDPAVRVLTGAAALGALVFLLRRP